MKNRYCGQKSFSDWYQNQKHELIISFGNCSVFTCTSFPLQLFTCSQPQSTPCRIQPQFLMSPCPVTYFYSHSTFQHHSITHLTVFFIMFIMFLLLIASVSRNLITLKMMFLSSFCSNYKVIVFVTISSSSIIMVFMSIALKSSNIQKNI